MIEKRNAGRVTKSRSVGRLGNAQAGVSARIGSVKGSPVSNELLDGIRIHASQGRDRLRELRNTQKLVLKLVFLASARPRASAAYTVGSK